MAFMLANCLVAAFVLIGARPQPQATPVTCAIDPVSASVAVAEMGKAAGVAMRTQGDIGEDVLTILVHDRPLSELMEKVAHVTYGEWKRDEQGYLLVRSKEAVVKARQRVRQRDMEAFRELVEPLSQAVGGAYDADHVRSVSDQRERLKQEESRPLESEDDIDEMEKRQKTLSRLELEDPMQRMLCRLVLSLDPAVVATLADNEDLTFSTQPTGDERPFGTNASWVLSLANQEQKVWSEVQSKRPRDEENDPWTNDDDNFLDFGDDDNLIMTIEPWSRSKPLAAPPAKAMLVLERQDRKRYAFKAALFDGKGKRLIAVEKEFGPEDSDTFELVAANGPDGVPLRPPSRAFEPRESIGYTDWTSSLAATPERDYVEVPRELSLWHQDPLRHDALSLFFAEALGSLHRKEGPQVVANLPDSTFSLGRQSVNGGPNGTPPTISGKGLFESLKKAPEMEVERPDGWISIRPFELDRAIGDRLNRGVMRAVLARVLRQPAATIEDHIDLASGMRGASRSGPSLYWSYLSTLSGRRFQIDGGSPWLTLKLLGAVSESQRRTLLSGGSVAYSFLPPASMTYVKRLLGRSTSSWSEGGSAEGGVVGLHGKRTGIRIVTFYDPKEPDRPIHQVNLSEDPSGVVFSGEQRVKVETLPELACQLRVADSFDLGIDKGNNVTRTITLSTKAVPTTAEPVPFRQLPGALQVEIVKYLRAQEKAAGG